MNLRKKVIEGFTHTYIENEQKIVRNLLQTGRLTEDEWDSICEQLSKLSESYQENDLGPEEYIRQRREIRKEIDKSREEKKSGMTREEADKLYKKVKKDQRKALKEAFEESDLSIFSILGKTLLARFNFIAARLKNI